MGKLLLPFTSTGRRDYSSAEEESSSLKSSRNEDSPTLKIKNAASKKYCIGSHTLGEWVFEALSLLLALLALIAITILLFTHQNKPQPKWPSYLSLNTILAIFTSTFKTAMLLPIAQGLGELKWMWFANSRPLSDFERFDWASRGPVGALRLLFKQSHNFWASFGALIVVLAIVVDPFTQQILSVHLCQSMMDPGSATIARSNYYGLPVAYTQDPAMQTAVNREIVGLPDNPTNAISFDCMTGNCSFPVDASHVSYRSLAMCYDVQDISNLIQLLATTGEGYSLSTVGSPGLTFEPYTVLNTTSVVTLPSQVYYNNGTVGLSVVEVSMFGGNIMMRNVNQSDFIEEAPWAISFNFWPCLRSYGNASIIDTRLYEERIEPDIRLLNVMQFPDNDTETILLSLAGNYPPFPGVDCTPAHSPQSGKTQSTILLPSGLDIFNTTPIEAPIVQSNYTFKVEWYDPACTWGIPIDTISIWEQLIAELFDTSETNSVLYEDYVSDFRAASPVSGPPWLTELYANGTANITSVDAYFKGMADSMTTVIRNNGSVSHVGPAPGMATETQICVNVKWAWLVLPVSLWIFTLVFFVLVVTGSSTNMRNVTKASRRGPWKSSSLPLLWCGLDENVKERYGTLIKLKKMEKCADDVYVSLNRSIAYEYDETGDHSGEGRWTLKQRDTSSEARDA